MTAARVRKDPPAVATLSLAQLADEHFGLTMGLERYNDRKKQIEDELAARNVVSAEGERGVVTLQMGDVGLIDIPRLRAALGKDICREYAIPGSDRFWRSQFRQRS